MEVPKFVRFIGNSLNDVGGLKSGDVVEVLTCGASYPERLYVKTPQQSIYSGDSAGYPEKLEGHNFTYLGEREYELTKEEEMKLEHKFRVGDIVRGNDAERYGITNSDMTEGIVTGVNSSGRIDIRVVKREGYEGDTIFSGLNPVYFDLVRKTSSKPATDVTDTLYHFTTDMKTFVSVEYDGNVAKSKCNLDLDEFDIHVGVDLVLERLNEIENLPVEKELPRYVRYIGDYDIGGLVKGDICRVLSGVPKRSPMYDDSIFVVSPNPTCYRPHEATNPEALEGVNFTYLWSTVYEAVDFNIFD